MVTRSLSITGQTGRGRARPGTADNYGVGTRTIKTIKAVKTVDDKDKG